MKDMKIINYAVLIMLCFTACKKTVEVTVPEFEVSTEKTTFSVGEDVKFLLKGDPGLISFYSGEPGSDYAYKDGRILSIIQIAMSFNSSMSFGTQLGQFTVLASTDFNGKYDIANVKAATWKDITSKFTLPVNATYVSSGVRDVSDLIVDGKPLYIVLRYIDDPAKAGTANNWLIQSFLMQSNTVLGTKALLDLTGWTLLYDGPKETTRSSISASTITLRGNANPPRVYTEDWCVSKIVNSGSIDVGPDRPAPIKTSRDAALSSFSYKYQAEGTYKVFFTAYNANIYGSKEVTRSVEIIVKK
jgi:hypothetical protein